MAQSGGKDDRTTSKAKLLNAFQAILAERQSLASQIATREEEAERERNRSVLETVSLYTADGIIRGLADLQLDFGNIITGLSVRLTTETNKLDDLQRAIQVETERLQELQQTRVVADALYLLTQEHQENLRQLEQQATRDHEMLEREMAATRKLWQQEQEEFESRVNESSELLQRERQQQEEEYSYETERSRKIATDDYEEANRQVEQAIQEKTQAQQKDWAERERLLASNQNLLEEYQRKVAAFPADLEEAVKKAREEGIRDANHDAKVKADLLEKEWEAAKQGYELQVQSLEGRIQKQTEQINEISTQLQTALRQAQELAMKAFDGSARTKTRNERSE